VVTNQPLPFGLINSEWKSAANGGRVQSAIGRDIRFEMSGKIPHVLVGYDPATGMIPSVLVIPSCNWEVDQSLFLYVGKAGLGASEEDAASVAAAGVLFIHTGAAATDYSGQSRTFTTNTGVTATVLGNWPAGVGNGSSAYRARTSAEMDGLAGLTWLAHLRADAGDIVQEAFNVAPSDTSQFSLAALADESWFQNINCGAVLTQLRTAAAQMVVGQAHALSGAWSSGTATDLVLDGDVPTLATTPGSTTGTTAISEALELFRGGRGTVGYWNGAIGLFLAVNRRLPLEARKAMTLALTTPSAVFGIGEANTAAVANRSPMAMPVSGQATVNTEVLFDVVAASYDPNGDTLTPSLPSPVSTGVARIVSGKVGFKLNSGVTLPISFPYRVSDGTKSSTGAIFVSAAPANGLSDLAYNGLMLGAACHDGGVGNLEVHNRTNRTQNALVMYLESLKPIVAIQWENRHDHPLAGNSGYSDATVVRVKSSGAYRAQASGDTSSTVDVIQLPQGGDIRWRIARVASSELSTGTLSLEAFVGQTDRINRCALAASWATEWARCGGTGAVPENWNSNSFLQYPTIWFTNGSGTLLPVDPVAQGWAIGDRIAFVIDNSASDSSSFPMAPDLSGNNRWQSGNGSRWVSVNLAFLRNRPNANRSSYRYAKNVGAWWNAYTMETEYWPNVLIGHRGSDGVMHVKGNAYVGYANDEYYQLSGTGRLRQIIKIPNDPLWAGRTIRAIDASIYRGSSGTTGSVRLGLRRAGSTVGGATDDGGSLLGSASFNAADLRFFDLRGLGSSGETAAAPATGFDAHQTVTLSSAVTVQPGQAYYIEFVSNGGAYRIGRQLNYFGRTGDASSGGKGLVRADHQDSTAVYQDATASGNWSTVTDHANSTNYLHLGVSMFFND
jgi:hypothetical protein